MMTMTNGVLLIYGMAFLVTFMILYAVANKKSEPLVSNDELNDLVDRQIKTLLPADFTTLEALSRKQAEIEMRLDRTHPSQQRAIDQLTSELQIIEDRLEEEAEYIDSRFHNVASNMEDLYHALPKKVVKKGKKNA